MTRTIIIALACTGCSLVLSGEEHEARDAGASIDAGDDAGSFDAGEDIEDAGRDGGMDAGEIDGGSDAGNDAGNDAGRDAGPECTTSTDCDDRDPCNGVESCNTTLRTCEPGTIPAAATACSGGVCRAGVCRTRCSPTAPFTSTRPLDELNAEGVDHGARLTVDERTLYFFRSETVGGDTDLAMATRTAPGPFGAPTVLPGEINSPAAASWWPSITADGRFIYAGGYPFGHSRIFVASRASTGVPFGALSELTSISVTSSAGEHNDHPYVLPDHSAMYISLRVEPGDWKVYRAARSGSTWATAQLVPGVDLDSSVADLTPVVTPDELTIYFGSERPGGLGQTDIYVATRTDAGAPFGPAVPLMFDDGVLRAFNTSGPDYATWISPDGCELYYSPDNLDLWVASRVP